jgi:hypothetical protein
MLMRPAAATIRTQLQLPLRFNDGRRGGHTLELPNVAALP